MPKKSRKSGSRVNSGDTQLTKIIWLLESIDGNLSFIADEIEKRFTGEEEPKPVGIIDQIAPILVGVMQGMSAQPSQQAPQMPQLPQAPHAGGQGVVPPTPNDNPFVIPPMPNDNPFTEQ
jgi:hypothetical protein